MSEDNEETQKVHDETASETASETQSELLAEALKAVPRTDSGETSVGIAPESDGGFASNRKFIDDANEAIDRSFDALEHDLYLARICAKAEILNEIFPVIRGLRARRKAKQQRA